MISPERIDSLQSGFLRLCGPRGVEPVAVYRVFDRLCEAYQQPTRYYHTLEHIAEMLKIVGRLSGSLTEYQTELMLAVWFHDCVYDATRSDNEAASVDYFRAELAGDLAPLANQVSESCIADFILLTKHTARITDEELHPAAKILLDADLAILGAAPTRYARYIADVRREFAHVDDAAWQAGRAAFLEAMLAKPRIYHTAVFQHEGEPLARVNLMAELQELRSSAE